MASPVLSRKILVGILLASAATAGGPRAAGSSQSWREVYVGGRLAWLEVEDVDDGDLNLGIFAGGRVSRYVAINGVLDYHTADFDLQNRETYALTASAEVYPMKRNASVQPYLLGGLGVYHSHFEFLDCCGNVIVDDSEWDFGFHAGGGMDIILSKDGGDRTALTLEVRRIFTDEESADDQVEPDGTLIAVGLKFRTH